jgi:hypothetical protein
VGVLAYLMPAVRSDGTGAGVDEVRVEADGAADVGVGILEVSGPLTSPDPRNCTGVMSDRRVLMFTSAP